MQINKHGGLAAKTYVVDQFEAVDLGAPFKVILHKSVRITESDGSDKIESYFIPDFEGLIRAVVLKRILHSRKLSGADIKFIRKAIGIKQRDMATRIEMTYEHLSRCEAGTLVMSPTSEKLLRIFALKTAMKLHKWKSCEAKTKLEDALDKLFDGVKSVPAHNVEDVLVLHFRWSRPSSDDAKDDNVDDGNGEWDGDQPAPAAAA